MTKNEMKEMRKEISQLTDFQQTYEELCNRIANGEVPDREWKGVADRISFLKGRVETGIEGVLRDYGIQIAWSSNSQKFITIPQN